MDFTIRSCPLYGANDAKTLLTLKPEEFLPHNSGYHAALLQELVDHHHANYHIVRCGACSFQYALELFPFSFATHLYENVIDHDHSHAKIFSRKRLVTNLNRWGELLDMLPSNPFARIIHENLRI